MQFAEGEFHIVHGEGTEAGLRAQFDIPGSQILSNLDNLCCGPLAPLEVPDDWDRMRRGYWAGAVGAEPQGLTIWQQLSAARDRLARAPAINLWLGPALDESLLTGYLLAAFDLLELDLERLRLVDMEPVFETVGGRARLGNFRTDLLRLIGPWGEMDRAAEACYRQIWRAATSASPELLAAFCRADTPWPSSLKEGLRSWLAWYPTVKSGLGFWDEMLLYNSSTSPVSAAQTIGGCLRHSTGLVDPGEAWLFHRLRRLADPELAWPLLEMNGDGRTFRHTLTNLTDAGIDVLNGDENAIVLNGIEDRIGGVTLNLGETGVWFYNGETLVRGGQVG